MKKNLCIIPARSGSKRIKNKNIINFAGKPIIYWSILAAKKTKLFNKIVVSSDGDKILNISKKYGADTYKRSKKFSTDEASLFSAVRDYLRNNKDLKWEKVCCLLPASPLVHHKDIIKGFRQLNKKNKFVIPITEYDFPIQKSLTKKKNNFLNYNDPKVALKNTQKLKKNFHDVGQFYWGFSKYFLKYKDIFNSKKVKGLNVPNYRVRDIDYPEDLKISKVIFEKVLKNN